MQSESLDMIPAQAPKDQRMKELLQRIASNAGMSGPEAFVQKMMDAMDAEDRADFESTYEEAKALGERVEIAYFAAGALFFVGDVFQLPFIVVKGYFAFKFVKAVWPMLAQATILGTEDR